MKKNYKKDSVLCKAETTRKAKRPYKKNGTIEKVAYAAGGTTAAAGVATALGGEAALWAIFSAGPGAALTGAAETSAFLAWLGGGSLAAGGGGMAAGSAVLAALGPVGWAAAGIGTLGIGAVLARKAWKKKHAIGE